MKIIENQRNNAPHGSNAVFIRLRCILEESYGLVSFPALFLGEQSLTAPSKHLRFGLTIAALAALGTLSACTTTPTAGTTGNTGQSARHCHHSRTGTDSLSTIPDAHTTRDSVDWPGYYAGTIPCASCEGIQVWLEFNRSGQKHPLQLGRKLSG